jgi:hypothetical protein
MTQHFHWNVGRQTRVCSPEDLAEDAPTILRNACSACRARQAVVVGGIFPNVDTADNMPGDGAVPLLRNLTDNTLRMIEYGLCAECAAKGQDVLDMIEGKAVQGVIALAKKHLWN